MDAQPKTQLSAVQAIRRLPHGKRGLGAACKHALEVLYREYAGGKPGYFEIAPEDLAGEFMRDRKTAADWLDEMERRDFLRKCGERHGRRRYYVFDPRDEVRVAPPPDPQLVFAELAEGEEGIDAQGAANPAEDAPTVAMPRLSDAGATSEERQALAEIDRLQRLALYRVERAAPRRLGEHLGDIRPKPPNPGGEKPAKSPGEFPGKSPAVISTTDTFNAQIEGVSVRTRTRSLLQRAAAGEIPGKSPESWTRSQHRELVAELLAAVPQLFEDVAITIVDGVQAGWLKWSRLEKKIAAARRASLARHGVIDAKHVCCYFLVGVRDMFNAARQPWPHGGKR